VYFKSNVSIQNCSPISRYSGLVKVQEKRIFVQTWEVVCSTPKKHSCRFLFVGLLNPMGMTAFNSVGTV